MLCDQASASEFRCSSTAFPRATHSRTQSPSYARCDPRRAPLTARKKGSGYENEGHCEGILVPRALLTRGQPSATRGSGQIHIKLASDWPQRNIWFIVNMNKNTQALHEALVSLWRKLGEKTLLKLKEQQYEAVRKIVVDNRPQKR